MHDKHKGAYNELLAITWLLARGYEVFRNISQHGAADLVATKDKETIFIDVKSGQRTKTGTPEQIKRGVKFLVVAADGIIEFAEPQPPLPDARCIECNRLIGKKQRFCSKSCNRSYGRRH